MISDILCDTEYIDLQRYRTIRAVENRTGEVTVKTDLKGSTGVLMGTLGVWSGVAFSKCVYCSLIHFL